MNQTIFYVPEYESKNPFYFAGNANYLSSIPDTVPNYQLWAQIDKLDTITSHYIILCTKSEDSSSFLYKVSLADNFQSVSRIFEISLDNVFYVPIERFLEHERNHPCVAIPDNNWSRCSLRFHEISAFYRLNIIPSLTQITFSQDVYFESMKELFYSTYKFPNTYPLEYALSSLFSEILFALEFFGFATPRNSDEILSLQESRNLSDRFINEIKRNNDSFTSNRFFAFSELKYAIIRYHTTCFPNRNIPSDIIDYESFSCLQRSIYFVHESLNKLGHISSLKTNFRETLFNGISNYQKVNNVISGFCDMYTLRNIYASIFTSGVDFFALCRMSDIKIINPEKPLCKNKMKITSSNSNNNQICDLLNHVLSCVFDRSEIPLWIINEAEKSLNEKIVKISELKNNIKSALDKTYAVEEALEYALDSKDKTNEKLIESCNVIREISDENMKIRKEFVNVRKRLRDMKKGNLLLAIIIIVLSIMVIKEFRNK